jgi:hypothetical protein
MNRAMGIAQAILFGSTTIVLAEGGNALAPSQLLGQTGTTHDGNNANPQLPLEPNRYWVGLWAGFSESGNADPAAAFGAVPATRSLDEPGCWRQIAESAAVVVK